MRFNVCLVTTAVQYQSMSLVTVNAPNTHHVFECVFCIFHCLYWEKMGVCGCMNNSLHLLVHSSHTKYLLRSAVWETFIKYRVCVCVWGLLKTKFGDSLVCHMKCKRWLNELSWDKVIKCFSVDMHVVWLWLLLSNESSSRTAKNVCPNRSSSFLFKHSIF